MSNHQRGQFVTISKKCWPVPYYNRCSPSRYGQKCVNMNYKCSVKTSFIAWKYNIFCLLHVYIPLHGEMHAPILLWAPCELFHFGQLKLSNTRIDVVLLMQYSMCHAVLLTELLFSKVRIKWVLWSPTTTTLTTNMWLHCVACFHEEDAMNDCN